MSISDFWFSVLASMVASILLALSAKITLEKWKQVAMGFGATTVVTLVIAFIVFAGLIVTKASFSYLERSSLQKKITA
jgi:hypothetical protein